MPNHYPNSILILSSLTWFCICGTLLRQVLTLLVHSTNTTLSLDGGGPIGSDFLSNILASVLMGIVSRCVRLRSSHSMPLLYIGLTSGICGSLSTFSGWQSQCNLLFFRGQVIDGLLSLTIGFIASYICLVFGHHIFNLISCLTCSNVIAAGESLGICRQGTRLRGTDTSISGNEMVIINTDEQCIDKSEGDQIDSDCTNYHDNSINSIEGQSTNSKASFPRSTLPYIWIMIGLSTWSTFIVLTATTQKARSWTFPSTLAPFGTGIRWFTSLRNDRWPRFKIWTFIVNILATIIAAILVILKTYTTTKIQKEVIDAFGVGFCGNLSTMSTFCYEVYHLPTEWSYIYSVITIGLSQGALFIIYGSFFGSGQSPIPSHITTI